MHLIKTIKINSKILSPENYLASKYTRDEYQNSITLMRTFIGQA